MVAIDKGQVLAADRKLTDEQQKLLRALPLTCAVTLRIRDIRKRRELTLEQLGERMGTTQETALRLETGKLPLNYKWLLLAANALDVEPAALFGAVELRDDDERRLVDLYRQLNAGDQDRLLLIAEGFAGPLEGRDENIYERENPPRRYNLHDK